MRLPSDGKGQTRAFEKFVHKIVAFMHVILRYRKYLLGAGTEHPIPDFGAAGFYCEGDLRCRQFMRFPSLRRPVPVIG